MLSYVVLCTVAAEEAVAFADVYVYREDFDVYAAKLHNSSGISCRFPEKSFRKRTVELHFCDFSQPTICIFYLLSLFHGSFPTYNLYLCAVKQETYGEISQLKKKESYEGLERKESGGIAQLRRRQLRGCGAAGGARREAGPLVYTDRSWPRYDGLHLHHRRGLGNGEGCGRQISIAARGHRPP